jgi:antitoxin MazE
MQIECGKWGNSLAIRIPAKLAKELGMVEGSAATLELEHGRLIISPAARPKRTLAMLIESLKQSGPDEEISTGPEIGNEIVEW